MLLTLDSSLTSVDTVEHTAQEFAVRAGFDEDTVLNIAMAVREAATNAVLHGNAYDPTKKIIVSFETSAEDLIIYVVADNPIGESCHYPDSNKWIVRSPERRLMRSEPLDYYDGEE